MTGIVDGIMFAFLVFSISLIFSWSKIFKWFSKLFQKDELHPKTKKPVKIPRVSLRMFMFYLQMFSVGVVALVIIYVVIDVFVLGFSFFSYITIPLAVGCFIVFSIAPFTFFRDPVYRLKKGKKKKSRKNYVE